jgi:hypothetical protein
MTGSSDTLEGVSHNHLPEKGNGDVIGLYINGQSIGVFPKNIANFFPNTNSISLYKINLKEISNTDLKPFSNLDLLHIQYNSLERTPSNLFQLTLKIKIVVFRGNQLRNVGSNFLSQLTQLSIVNFVENPCINVEVVNDAKQMVELLYKIAVFCPPTFEMFETSLLSSENFYSVIDAHIDNQAKLLSSAMLSMMETERKDRKTADERINQKIDDLTLEIVELGKQY